MLNDNRHQYVIQSNDPKGDEGFGKFFGAIIVFVMFLGAVEVSLEMLRAWYRNAENWVNETAGYLGVFWPF